MEAVISEGDLLKVLERIFEEAETQARFNGEEFLGLTMEQVGDMVRERLGSDW
jgi:hypothetical protein